MPTIDLKEAISDFSRLIDQASNGEFITITRHGKRFAVMVSVEAAEIALKALKNKQSRLAVYLRIFPGADPERNRSPSQTIKLWRVSFRYESHFYILVQACQATAA